ncbi:hypothetical protein K2X33_04740 [bacterium]|nr:hypothetical protein [bacterium]
MKKSKHGSSAWFPRLALIVGALPQALWALGLGVPNGEDGAQQYYQVYDDVLVRSDCPVGVVPTESSCTSNRVALAYYSRVRNAVDYEQRAALQLHSDAISKEVTRLQEADPNVKSLRSSIAQAAQKSAELDAAISGVVREIKVAENNAQLVQSQLDAILDALKKNPSQSDLRRLLAEQKRYEGLQQKYKGIAADLNQKKATAEQEKTGQGDLILAKNGELNTYLGELEVTSDVLVDLEDRYQCLTNERSQLPELDARVNQGLSYDLANWKAPGAAALFGRFMAHVHKAERPRVKYH